MVVSRGRSVNMGTITSGSTFTSRKPFFLSSINDPAFLSNSSIFSYIFHGCFDHDRTAFCASRVTLFSCMYWRDVRSNVTIIINQANSNKKAHQTEDAISREFGKSYNADYFKDLSINNLVGSITQEHLNDTGDTLNFLKEFGKPVTFPNLESYKPVTQSACATIRGKDHLINQSISQLHLILLPILLLILLPTTFHLCRIMYRLSRCYLSLCIYAVLLALLELALFLLQGVDMWVESLTQRSFTMTLILSYPSLCEVYHFVYNFIYHLRCLLYPTIAVDTWRLLRDPKTFYFTHTKAWIRSCIILIIAIVATCNSQFLWTFSVVKYEPSFTKDSGYMCTFSVKHVDNRYRDYIWPLIDLTLGNIIPFTVTLVYVILGTRLYCKSRRDKARQYAALDRYIINVKLFYKLCAAFLVYCVLFTLSLIPELILFWVKYAAYIEERIQDQVKSDDGSYMYANSIVRETRRQEKKANRLLIEAPLEYFETAALYSHFIFICVVKFLIFFFMIDKMRIMRPGEQKLNSVLLMTKKTKSKPTPSPSAQPLNSSPRHLSTVCNNTEGSHSNITRIVYQQNSIDF